MLKWLPELRPDGKPRYLQIADAIELAIKRGDIAAGDRLPPQRRLAERLKIDFGRQVSRAYAEAHSRRLVESHVGRGTFALGRPKEEHRIDPRRAGDEDLSMNTCLPSRRT